MAVEDDRLMTTADVIVSELLSFSIFIQQRFGIKLWFTEALQFIFNHLQPTLLAKMVANYCYLSFQFGLIPRKKCFLQLLQLPGLSQLLVDVRFLPRMWVLWGIVLLCILTQSPYRVATTQVLRPSPELHHSRSLRPSPKGKSSAQISIHT